MPAQLLAAQRSARAPVQLSVRCGSAVIRDIRLWHRGVPNTSAQARPMIAMIHQCRWLGSGSLPIPAGAEGYFTYWDDLAGPPARAYYSFDLADWHIIALNSVIDSSVGSQQYLWLRQDLSQTKSRCILAYWHHPIFVSNSKIRRDDTTLALYEALYESGASVVLAGHTHRYERFAPLDPEGLLDEARGIRSFIVGTGGATLYHARRIHPHTEYLDSEHWGVLRLTLDQGRYEWEFLTSDGRVTDRGSAPCVDRSAN